MDVIYHPSTLQEYKLHSPEGKELLRQLLKKYSHWGGGKKKSKENKKKEDDKKK